MIYASVKKKHSVNTLRRRTHVYKGSQDGEFKCLWSSELWSKCVNLIVSFFSGYGSCPAKGVAEVRVRSQRGSGRKFQVSYHNRLLVQEMALREIPGKFSVQAHGSCCVFTRVGYPLPMDFSVSALCSSSKLIVSVPALYKEMRFNCALLPACCQCSKPVCYSRLRHNVSKSVASMILGVLEDGNLA